MWQSVSGRLVHDIAVRGAPKLVYHLQIFRREAAVLFCLTSIVSQSLQLKTRFSRKNFNSGRPALES